MCLRILRVMRPTPNAVHQHGAGKTLITTCFDMRLATRLACSRSAAFVEHMVRKVGHRMLTRHLWQYYELNREPPVGLCHCNYRWLVYHSKTLFSQCTLTPVAPVRLRDRAVDGGEGVLVCVELLRAQKNVEALTGELLTYSFAKACRPIEP